MVEFLENPPYCWSGWLTQQCILLYKLFRFNEQDFQVNIRVFFATNFYDRVVSTLPAGCGGASAEPSNIPKHIPHWFIYEYYGINKWILSNAKSSIFIAVKSASFQCQSFRPRERCSFENACEWLRIVNVHVCSGTGVGCEAFLCFFFFFYFFFAAHNEGSSHKINNTSLNVLKSQMQKIWSTWNITIFHEVSEGYPVGLRRL